MMDFSLLCSICLQEMDEDSTVVVHEKGLRTLIKKSQEKNDDKWKQWMKKDSYSFHILCRKRYAVSSSKSTSKSAKGSHIITVPKPYKIDSKSQSIERSVPSSAPFSGCNDNFEYEKLCFICGKKWDRTKRGSIVSANNIKDRLITAAREHNDDFGASIITRLQSIGSLVESKARYHTVCYNKLMASLYKKSSSPQSKNKNNKFERIYEHIETSGEFEFHLSNLRELMGDDEDYQIDNRTLLRHLKKKYENDIVIFQHKGKDTLIYYKFHDMAKICSDWYGGTELLSECAKKTIVKMSAEIIQDEIKKFEYDTTIYPKPQEFLDSVASDIPPLLKTFLHKLIVTNEREGTNESSLFVKIENLAHSIISTLRPKSFISCLQLSVGTYVYRKTGSRLVINLLNKLGVCSSYHNIRLYEASTIVNPQTTAIEDTFVQYVFNNTNRQKQT